MYRITGKKSRTEFKAGIGQNDIAFTLDNNDLIATIAQSGDTIRITDWISSLWLRIDHPGIGCFSTFASSRFKESLYKQSS